MYKVVVLPSSISLAFKKPPPSTVAFLPVNLVVPSIVALPVKVTFSLEVKLPATVVAPANTVVPDKLTSPPLPFLSLETLTMPLNSETVLSSLAVKVKLPVTFKMLSAVESTLPTIMSLLT